jgi:two-component system nitrate/nitrite response regulator NarL
MSSINLPLAEEHDTAFNILIADDHQMIVDGIIGMLAGEQEYRVAGTAPDGQQAMEMIGSSPNDYDVLLTDISMPLLSGIELCKIVKASYPRIQVLVLSMYSTMAAVQEAVMAEADGYILKSSGKAELLKALHRITEGGTYFSEAILPIIYNQFQKAKAQEDFQRLLSVRELEILALIVKERTSEEIGKTLFISKKTVDNHRAHMLEKTGCKTTIGLVKWAIKNGVVVGD